MTLGELENERLSGGDTSGSIGSDSGSDGRSGGSGSDGSADGSGGSVDGSGGSDGRSASDGSAGSVGSDNVITDNGEGDAHRNSTDNRSSRAERIRRRSGIRLDAGNRDSAGGSSASAGREEERDNGYSEEPVIRLGAKTQGAPKNVKPEQKSKGKLSEVKDLIKVFVDSCFEIPALTLKQDFWKLDKDESKALTDAVIAWLESMPSADQSKIAEFVGKHVPLINLAMVAFFIVSERVKMSMAVHQVTKAGRTFSEAVNTPTGAAAANGAPVKTAMDSMFNN